MSDRWTDYMAETDQLVDGLGKPIDAGILETVTALRAWGFVTTGSCEGHPDHGTPHPWVDISRDAATRRRLTKERNELFEDQALREVDQPLSLEANRLVALLEQFYGEHQVAFYRVTLVVRRGLPFVMRLEPAGVLVTSTYEEPERWLPLYQAEMQRFGSWLRLHVSETGIRRD